jgi:hypothetical protein
MEHVPRKAPLTRDEFHAALRAWHADAMDDDVIRPPPSRYEEVYDGDDWVWVKHLGNRFYLHADTSFPGVTRYLELLAAEGESLRWQAPAGSGEREVVFGAGCVAIEGFRLLRAT